MGNRKKKQTQTTGCHIQIITVEDVVDTQEEIQRKTEVRITVYKYYKTQQLRWYGHVKRMEEQRWSIRILEWTP